MGPPPRWAGPAAAIEQHADGDDDPPQPGPLIQNPKIEMIELEHITKKYGSKVAVNDLDLTIARGELFAFLGPNGAGKTTTIKIMCGLLFPSSGRVRIGGFDLHD